MSTHIVLDTILFDADGTPVMCGPGNEFWAKYNAQANLHLNLYYDLYRSGELEKLAEYSTRHSSTKDPTKTYFDFVLDLDKLPKELIAKLNEKHPGNWIDDILADKCSPCSFCGCYGLVLMPYKSYRDVCGTISSSWESPLVEAFHYPDCNDFWKIKQGQGAREAGIEVIKRFWGDSDTKAMTQEEYNQLCDEQEKAWQEENSDTTNEVV